MKIKILFAILCIGYSAFAQKETDTSMKTFMKIDGSPSGIGISLETPLSKKLLFEAETGLGAGYNINDNSFKYIMNFDNPSFYASLKGKFYYNRGKRAAKGKGIFMNAGNFIGFRLKYTSEGIFGQETYNQIYGYNPFYGYNTLYYNGYGGYYNYTYHSYSSSATFNTLLGNIHWGIQRQIGKYWMYSFYLGAGYAYDIDYKQGTVYPAVDLKVSYVLPFFGKKNIR